MQHRGHHRRLARQLREAHLRATGPEAQDLNRLERLVRCDALTVFQASELLRDVIRAQHQRERRAEAA